MRIGELAALVGVSTRTVRHYHRIGLLAEPARQANGYRVYELRHAVALSRIRRLTELGLSLDEIADATANDAGRDLSEALAELDADLARQEATLRARLAELLAQAEEHGGLPAEGPVSPELTAFFREMARTAETLPGPEPATAAKERALFALLDGTPAAPASAAQDASRAWLTELLAAMDSDPAAMRRAYEVYAQMDELATASPDDPRVEVVARAVAEASPEELVRAMAAAGDQDGAAERQDSGFVAAFFADYSPAQAEAIRRAIQLLRESGR